MSELDATDLICKARRQALTDQERRRLEELVSSRVDARLMQLMQPDFEHCGRVQRGDEALAIRLAERAMVQARAQSQFRGVRKLPKVGWLLAAAILMGATASAAWWSSRQPIEIPAAAVVTAESRVDAAPRHTARQQKTALPPLPSAETVEASAVPSTPAREPEPPPGSGAGPNLSPVTRVSSRPRVAVSELFTKANQLRRDGRLGEAVDIYRTIFVEHANTREAPLARLAVAKYYSRNRPREALTHYQVIANSHGTLRAEALWGVVETAALAGQSQVRQQALADLLQEFPDSPYAAYARKGMLNREN